jgi:hypothetical protein
MKLRAVDYLEWLKTQEEIILWEMELAEDAADNLHIEEIEEDLQLVREIKGIIEAWRKDGKD